MRKIVGVHSLLALTALMSFAAQHSQAATRYVTARVPMAGFSRDISAVRPSGLVSTESATTPAGHPSNTWTKLATLSGAVVHDIAFATATRGYAAAELGQIWETRDGGNTWKLILNRNFPYYYYGIAVAGKKVVATGFNDSTGQGILSESDDGGKSWNGDVILSSNDWAGRVRFTKGISDGLVMSGEGLAHPNAAWWTMQPDNWAQVTPDPNGGWFGYQFTVLKDQTAYASGINFCKSSDLGATWACAAPADSVFDGPTLFVSDSIGWTGGGEISPNVEGWLHRTTDGGTTWSGRVLKSPWPIRQIEFLSKKIGWAAGGNIYSNVGGIYYTSDGGKTWSLDLDSGDEVGACAHANLGNGTTQVWCIADAYSGNFFSNVYSTTVPTP